jgi:hypothetical protein
LNGPWRESIIDHNIIVAAIIHNSLDDDAAALAPAIVVISLHTNHTHLVIISFIGFCNDNARRGGSKDCGTRGQQIERVEVSPTRKQDTASQTSLAQYHTVP